MSRPLEARFVHQLRAEVFALDRDERGPERIGAEVELLPVVAATGRLAPIDAPDSPSTLPVVRRIARARGWCESSSDKAGVPEWRTPAGGRITYEPGGQIEYSAPPFGSVSALLGELHQTADIVRDALAAEGIALQGIGVDAVSPVEDVPLQLTAPRYRRMDAHFATIGRDGARMMRQTASIQVCLDAGPEPLRRWRLLNALAPYLAAIFANAPVYEGRPTGFQSERRRIWGALDPARTGLPWSDRDPIGTYARFALHATAMLADPKDGTLRTFGERMDNGGANLDDWRAHLTTLFPEVRPRGYFEVRTIDALDPAQYAAPLVLLAGLTWHLPTMEVAEEIVGDPDAALLERAGRLALRDPVLGPAAIALCDTALAGCESLGPAVVARADLCAAADFFDRLTRRGRAPASAVAPAFE